MDKRKGKQTVKKKFASLLLTGLLVTTVVSVEALVVRAAEERQGQIVANEDYEPINMVAGNTNGGLDEVETCEPTIQITLSETQRVMKPAETCQLEATIATDLVSYEVGWSSSNPEVANVDNIGQICAITAGTSTITATVKTLVGDKEVTSTASCLITVIEPANYQEFIYEELGNGEVGIIGYKGSREIVEVPSHIDGKEVVSINNCFYYDNVVKEITLPDTIRFLGSIGYDCSNLEKLTINTYNPGEGSQISSYTYSNGNFSHCQKLKTIIVNENSNLKTFSVKDNVLYYGTEESLSLVLYPAGKNDSEYIFGESMQVGSWAFEGNEYIKKVTFEKPLKDTVNVTNDEPMASAGVFRYCKNLESVSFTGLTMIRGWFDGCTNLKTVELPNTLKTLGSGTFNFCTALETISVPQNVSLIESTAFQGCTSLKSCIIYNDDIKFEKIEINGREVETIWNDCDNVVVYCNRGSNGEAYAEKFGIPYGIIGSEAVITTPPVITAEPTTLTSVPREYKIKYILNKGKNNKLNPATYSNKNIKLQAPIRKGYTFAGWYTDKKFKTKITTIKASVKQDIILYAKWEKVKNPAKPVLKSVSNIKENKLKVTLMKEVTGAKGYELAYSTDKKWKKSIKKVSFKGTSQKVSNLKKNKIYYVKVRAYKLDSAGEKVYGSYSKTKKVKIKK